jgi:hypothetical protein
MSSTLCLLTTEDLQQLAAALRSGRIVPPINALLLRRYIPASLADSIAEELRQKFEDGAQPRQLAELLDIVIQDRRRRPVAENLIDLVWTGPEVEGIVNRDTAVVVREMFRSARESVLVAGYSVYPVVSLKKTQPLIRRTALKAASPGRNLPGGNQTPTGPDTGDAP